MPGLASRVRERVLARRGLGEALVIGSPAKPDTPWRQRQRSAATARLYTELADELGMEDLATARTHVWRATLNSVFIELPESTRAAYFGHTVAVNRARYTGTSDTSAMVEAARSVLP